MSAPSSWDFAHPHLKIAQEVSVAGLFSFSQPGTNEAKVRGLLLKRTNLFTLPCGHRFYSQTLMKMHAVFCFVIFSFQRWDQR